MQPISGCLAIHCARLCTTWPRLPATTGEYAPRMLTYPAKVEWPGRKNLLSFRTVMSTGRSAVVVIEQPIRSPVAATLPPMTTLITTIRSGGQTGVDRGALDAARAVGVPIEGWCPAGGWAEDMPEAPGLLTDYPELRETPSPEPAQRTEWNVRDSDVTLIIGPVADTKSSEVSPGTALTRELAASISRPVRTVEKGDIEDTVEWLRNQGTELTVNIAGPRESE